MGSIYDLNNEYDEDVINVKRLMSSLDRNVDDDDIPTLSKILKMNEPLLRRTLNSLNQVDIIKW